MTDGPRVGVVGTGRWGRNLVRNFSTLGALAALCDRNAATLAELASRYPEASTHAEAERLLDDPGIDAVAIATPSRTHGELVRAALEAGKAVLVEKPMCTDLAQAHALNALAERRRRVLMVGHLLLYHPAFVALRDFVSNGGIGEPTYVYSQRLDFRDERGTDDALWDFAPHDVSMLLALAEESPVKVTATGSAAIEPGVVDTVLAQFAFGGPLRAHLFVSWMQPAKEQRLVVVGQGGTAVFDDMLPGARKLMCYPHEAIWDSAHPRVSRADAVAIPFPVNEPLALECAHFLECVATGRTPRSDGEEGCRVLSVLDACARSLGSGGAVAVDGAPPAQPRSAAGI
jgi:UDP-2-acetamido-3-amino-2,3-dideoxy-glucuronate N-acetyltransferase